MLSTSEKIRPEIKVELIEGHTDEEVKYTLGKMCLVLTQISAGLKGWL
jgi:hypothetical protein